MVELKILNKKTMAVFTLEFENVADAIKRANRIRHGRKLLILSAIFSTPEENEEYSRCVK